MKVVLISSIAFGIGFTVLGIVLMLMSYTNVGIALAILSQLAALFAALSYAKYTEDIEPT